jgi:hypothetical protein
MTTFNISRDVSGAVAYGLPFCDNNEYIELDMGVEATTTVPDDTNFTNFNVVFAYTPGGSVWVADGSVAITLPTNSFAATPAVLNPPVRTAKAGDTLRFLTGDTGTCVGVSYYGVS